MKWHCLHLPNNFWIFEPISNTFGRGIGIIPTLRCYACNEKNLHRKKSLYQEKGSIFVIRENIIEERSGMERLDHRLHFILLTSLLSSENDLAGNRSNHIAQMHRASPTVRHLIHLLSQQNSASNHGQTVIHTKDGWRLCTEGHPRIVCQASVAEPGKFTCKFYC